MSGKLYIVSTPIGNYGDMTYRAVETLRSVDLIACEDTRKTGILLKHFEIEGKLFSYHDHNENFKTEILVQRLLAGENVAVVSDAGTPCISDPGYRIVRAARENGIAVEGVPGACAAVNGLVVSGIPTDSFVFEGFLPHKKGRQTKLKAIAEEKRTIVLYESVHRIEKLLKELIGLMPERKMCVLREMTKTFEQHICGTPAELLKELEASQIKGEFVIVIEGKKD
ncbi:MAG: 16S rRNA (cytidine(1402)-2'-O)-methyltransferase [Candidatus Delongbacteria bacterium]|jgi:16S rRNA (cytidine1402-2'-O)-methyltransferase|nr:16S rRNA (cytidine(1402)-2'-O)-methyltransferase [Candidatus Delongbacteria bacterium]